MAGMSKGLGTTAPAGWGPVEDTLFALVLAYGSAVRSSRWDLASIYLSQFQGIWTLYGNLIKAHALANGASTTAINAVPDDLTADGVLGVRTSKVIAAVLAWALDTVLHDAIVSTPTDISGVSVWFSAKVIPHVDPSTGYWAIWNATKNASASDVADNVVGQVAAAYMSGGPSALAHFEAQPRTTTPTPNTSPGTGTAPMPTRLPTIGPTIAVTGQANTTPWWVWAAGGTVLLGAVVGGFYYIGKHRPDLFKAKKKRKR